MRVGVVVSFMNGFGEKGQYHSQELGLAKQFVKEGHTVEVYKATNDNSVISELIDDSTTVKYCPCRKFGAQGLLDPSVFSKNLDALVYFSDTQLSVNIIDSWCVENDVRPIYYVGAVESTSDNVYIRHLMNLHYRLRTLPIYRKRGAIAKTPFIKRKLEEQGVQSVYLAPVGIDFDLMDAPDGETEDLSLPREDDERLLLYVGKLERYKYPGNALDLLPLLPDFFKLIIVGKGSMEAELKKRANRLGVAERIVWIPSVPNSRMRRYYDAADFFVNVNPEEIFGMAVVEAVYHGCRTLALSAPGPDFILDGMKCHQSVSSLDEMASTIATSGECSPADLMSDTTMLVERCSWHVLVNLVEKIARRGPLSSEHLFNL